MTNNVNSAPYVLVLDDEPETVRSGAALGWSGRVEFDVVHPANVERQHVMKADLVLVDYQLEHWHERDSLRNIACQPENGLALAALLREHVDRSPGVRPISFALHTGHLSKAQGRLTLVEANARHVVARFNNLEWVFPKTDVRRYDQMLLLADATRRLPRAWPTESEESAVRARTLLDMDETASWFHRCWREVRECQPPIHELAGGGHGVLFVRWLLHQIMPYPCFLWDVHWVGARLHLPMHVLQRVLTESSGLSEDLKSIRYSGILAGFLGDRWWRGALEDYVWRLCEGDMSRLRAMLNERAGENLETVELEQPVACLGLELLPSAKLVAAGDAVNLRPDQWPAFADSAWMDIETVVENPALRAMVDPLDEYRLPDAEDV